MTVLRGHRRVARIRAAGREGRNRAVWRGRRVRPGRYTFTIRARDARGATARASGVLVLRR